MNSLQLFEIFNSLRLPGPGGRADDQPDRLLHPPDPGHDPHGDQAARGRGPGVLRACAPARGDRRPALRRRDAGGRGGRAQGAPLPDAGDGRRRGPPLRRPLPLAAVLGPHRATSRSWSSWPAPSSAAMFGYRDSNFTIAEGATRAGRRRGRPDDAARGLHRHLRHDDRRPDRLRQQGHRLQGRPGDRPARASGSTTRYRYGGTTFYQAFFGSAAVMTIKDEAGKALVSRGHPVRVAGRRRRAAARPSTRVPNSDQVVWVIGTTGGADPAIKPGQVEVQVYNAGESAPVDDQGHRPGHGDHRRPA